MNLQVKQVIQVLNLGGIAIIPTDTLYGICARVGDKKAIKKIYKIKDRDKTKPLIVLINKIEDLKLFEVNLSIDQVGCFKPKTSIILSVPKNKFKYIHRETSAIAFRLINKKNLNLWNIINSVGPIVAPSANPEGLNPAINIKQAKDYFGNNVDVYLDGGIRKGKPSTIIDFTTKKSKILRK